MEYLANLKEIEVPQWFGKQVNKSTSQENFSEVNEWCKLIEFLVDPNKLIKVHKETLIISKSDILTLVHTFTLLGYDEFVPTYIETILTNKEAKIPEFKFFTKLMDVVEKNVGERLIKVLALNQFS